MTKKQEALLEVLNDKLRVANAQYTKFCDDIITDSKYINRLNAAMERQKVRDLKMFIELVKES